MAQDVTEPTTSDSSSASSLMESLQVLLGQIQEVVFVVPDDTGLVSLEEDLVAMVQEFMAQTVELLGALGNHYDPDHVAASGDAETMAEPSEDAFLKEIGAQISTELAAREVSDLAFIARSQLQGIGESLDAALRRRQIWAVASHADTGLRRAGKALVALESAICEFENLPTPDRQWVELDLSLKIRQLYSRFRRAVGRLERPEARMIERLQGVTGCIAELRQLDIYPFFRIEDRMTIRSLQKRIGSLLETSPDDEDAASRLWQDAVSLTQLLADVNRRAELRQHDTHVLNGLIHRLDMTSTDRPLAGTAWLDALSALEGLDDTLDEYLEAQRASASPDVEPTPPVAYLLRRLHNAMKPAEGAGSTDLDF